MIQQYLIEPQWANWMVTLEMFIAGLAAGSFLFIAFANIAGTQEDREVASRVGLLPGPLIVVAALLLTFDLGEPGRFLNQIFTHPSAAERPGPFMLNPNSPLNFGTYIILVFGLFQILIFGDALLHTVWRRRLAIERFLPFLRPLTEGLAHNPLYLAIGGVFAFATGAYSGVLINVTNQNVWSDTYILGGLYLTFSVLSGFAVAAIVADRQRAWQTAGAARSGILGSSVIAAVLLALLVANLVALGKAAPLIATMTALVAPVFWIGVVGLAIVYPIAVILTRSRLAIAGTPVGRLAVVGVVVLVGVLAFRYALLFSALAAVEG